MQEVPNYYFTGRLANLNMSFSVVKLESFLNLDIL